MQGRLQALQQIMGLPMDSEEQLDALPTEELRRRCEALLVECGAITDNNFLSCPLMAVSSVRAAAQWLSRD